MVRQRGDHLVMQRQVPGSTITVPVPYPHVREAGLSVRNGFVSLVEAA